MIVINQHFTTHRFGLYVVQMYICNLNILYPIWKYYYGYFYIVGFKTLVLSSDKIKLLLTMVNYVIDTYLFIFLSKISI